MLEAFEADWLRFVLDLTMAPLVDGLGLVTFLVLRLEEALERRERPMVVVVVVDVDVVITNLLIDDTVEVLALVRMTILFYTRRWVENDASSLLSFLVIMFVMK